jgi:hypothetical protein
MSDGNESGTFVPLEAAPAEQFERKKWETEIAFRERELKLKENESRPSLFKNALFVSVAAALIGLLIHSASEFGMQWVQHDENARREQTALITKALENDDPHRAIKRLKLLSEMTLIPDFKKLVETLDSDPDNARFSADNGRQYQAALIQQAIVNDDLDKVMRKLLLLDDAGLIPDLERTSKLGQIILAFRELAATQNPTLPARTGAAAAAPSTVPTATATTPATTPTATTTAPAATPAPAPTATTPAATTMAPAATSTTPAATAPASIVTVTTQAATATAPPDSCTNAATTRLSAVGWIYLGRLNQNKSAWVESDSGSRSISFEQPLSTPDPDLVNKLLKQCFRTVVAKYLRDDVWPGLKVRAPVKLTLREGSRLRIIDTDATAIDEPTTNRYPVVWAKVEVLSD